MKNFYRKIKNVRHIFNLINEINSNFSSVYSKVNLLPFNLLKIFTDDYNIKIRSEHYNIGDNIIEYYFTSYKELQIHTPLNHNERMSFTYNNTYFKENIFIYKLFFEQKKLETIVSLLEDILLISKHISSILNWRVNFINITPVENSTLLDALNKTKELNIDKNYTVNFWILTSKDPIILFQKITNLDPDFFHDVKEEDLNVLINKLLINIGSNTSASYIRKQKEYENIKLNYLKLIQPISLNYELNRDLQHKPKDVKKTKI